MKKLLLFIMCGLLLIGLTGCGETKKEEEKKEEEQKEETRIGVNGQKLTNNVATIVNNDGKTEKKSWADLNDLIKQNDEYYRKHYNGAKITIIDTVYKIESNYFEYDLDSRVYELVLSGGWYVYIDPSKADLSEVLQGTKVEIHSYLHDNNYWPVVHGTYQLPAGASAHYGKAHEVSDTTIKVLPE